MYSGSSVPVATLGCMPKTLQQSTVHKILIWIPAFAGMTSLNVHSTLKASLIHVILNFLSAAGVMVTTSKRQAMDI